MARSHSDSGSVSDEASLELLFVLTISIMLCKSPVEGKSWSLELEALPFVGLACMYGPVLTPAKKLFTPVPEKRKLLHQFTPRLEIIHSPIPYKCTLHVMGQ